MASHQITKAIFQEGLSISRPPLFNDLYYNQRKTKMKNYVQSTDYKTWIVIQNEPRPILKNNERKFERMTIDLTTKKKAVRYYANKC